MKKYYFFFIASLIAILSLGYSLIQDNNNQNDFQAYQNTDNELVSDVKKIESEINEKILKKIS
ncbi:MAG: hypothetical protein OEL56_00335 [Nitrosopumilus sp.]|nr:hypothetical protein [Nitrosopumilus sp.]MDH3515444.1 hypothetical protein [Nitrosopumilus sp.]MDH3564255.1 hypothetical protein [Nitrosopumilus sp.]MDH5416602.1 hypothetical protein [Nitrosopumilus sp.]MDH5555131.1 hypothetical protein [Nitrosopumilus sp.]